MSVLGCHYPLAGFGVRNMTVVAPGSFLSPEAYHNLRASTSDPTGRNMDFTDLAPGQTLEVANLKGPGEITHLWFTFFGQEYHSRMLVLRMYWDGSDSPAVESPVGDFFLQGHGLQLDISSLPLVVTNAGAARNCYFRMPFKKSARITLENQGSESIRCYANVDWRKLERARSNLLYFHAKYHQQWPTEGRLDLEGTFQQQMTSSGRIEGLENRAGADNYVILDTKGEGFYVGTALGVYANSVGWWGEGDEMIFIDETTSPTLSGTGTEDYFGNAWGFMVKQTPYYGVPFSEFWRKGSRACAYRFHLDDPIAFHDSIRVTVEHGHANSRSDDYSSVAFWYQDSPTDDFGHLPPVILRLSPEMRSTRAMMHAFKESWRLETAGRLTEAMSVVEETLHLFPDFRSLQDNLRLRLGRLQLMAGNLAEAKASFLRVDRESESRLAQDLAKDYLWLFESENNALLYVNGDDRFDVYLDDQKLTRGDVFYGGLQRLRIKLDPGLHLIRAEVKNVFLFGGFYAEVLTLRDVVGTDKTWEVSSQLKEDFLNDYNSITPWKPASEYGTQFSRVSMSSHLSPTEWLGLPCQWIWDDKNYFPNRTLYFRREFYTNKKAWSDRTLPDLL
ncbi:MAG: glycoside hydrolase family 172 protein [bacterium]